MDLGGDPPPHLRGGVLGSSPLLADGTMWLEATKALGQCKCPACRWHHSHGPRSDALISDPPSALFSEAIIHTERESSSLSTCPIPCPGALSPHQCPQMLFNSTDRIPGPESRSQDASSWAQQGLKHGGERAKAGLKHLARHGWGRERCPTALALMATCWECPKAGNELLHMALRWHRCLAHCANACGFGRALDPAPAGHHRELHQHCCSCCWAGNVSGCPRAWAGVLPLLTPLLVTSTQELGNQRDCSVHISKGTEL